LVDRPLLPRTRLDSHLAPTKVGRQIAALFPFFSSFLGCARPFFVDRAGLPPFFSYFPEKVSRCVILFADEGAEIRSVDSAFFSVPLSRPFSYLRLFVSTFLHLGPSDSLKEKSGVVLKCRRRSVFPCVSPSVSFFPTPKWPHFLFSLSLAEQPFRLGCATKFPFLNSPADSMTSLVLPFLRFSF